MFSLTKGNRRDLESEIHGSTCKNNNVHFDSHHDPGRVFNNVFKAKNIRLNEMLALIFILFWIIYVKVIYL